jgi:hypothetical protein
VPSSGGFSGPVEVDVQATAGTSAVLDDPLLIFPASSDGNETSDHAASDPGTVVSERDRRCPALNHPVWDCDNRGLSRWRTTDGVMHLRLAEPLLFFIPDTGKDPQGADRRRVWVLATITRKGPLLRWGLRMRVRAIFSGWIWTRVLFSFIHFCCSPQLGSESASVPVDDIFAGSGCIGPSRPRAPLRMTRRL